MKSVKSEEKFFPQFNMSKLKCLRNRATLVSSAGRAHDRYELRVTCWCSQLAMTLAQCQNFSASMKKWEMWCRGKGLTRSNRVRIYEARMGTASGYRVLKYVVRAHGNTKQWPVAERSVSRAQVFEQCSTV